jgi:putative chitinase
MASKQFYDTIRPVLFPHGITQSHVDGFEAILKTCTVLSDQRQVAYVLATIYHECDGTMQPIEESGKGAGYDYGKKLKRGGGPGKRIPYETPDQIYYGRGYVQLTWYENYAIQSKLLDMDLLNRPELALQPDIASKILIHGMIHGDFTGHYLAQFINTNECDYVNARKIINGLDCAEKIAGYAQLFEEALKTT